MQDKIKIAQENLRNQEMLVTKSTTLQFSDPSCLVSTISSHHKAPYRMRPGYFSLVSATFLVNRDLNVKERDARVPDGCLGT